jgi:hypothetical protein
MASQFNRRHRKPVQGPQRDFWYLHSTTGWGPRGPRYGTLAELVVLLDTLLADITKEHERALAAVEKYIVEHPGPISGNDQIAGELFDEESDSIPGDRKCIMRNLHRKDFRHGGGDADCTCPEDPGNPNSCCYVLRITTPEEFAECFHWNIATRQMEFPQISAANRARHSVDAAPIVAYLLAALPTNLIEACVPRDLE